MQIDRELDLKGEVCPFTFVKSKLIIEQMDKGQVLRVILDYKPSVENVPKSMEMEGQEVLAVNQIGENLWEVLVRKVK
ncbi:MAG TPA: sulfurtransferase TusA family protein [Sulfurihydrogenibium sp.]|jgi:TusA-related sulfurtransferase|uniref:sulfurtransferase TusA family protein n=1 Tax=unclassified Sulfurihydrogenibium TaxID=2619248 RepID=UPI0001725054|nr:MULTISPECIES: sulfurtransferase TusA family protein [unclassified Sulfurihydrogenibium]ACD66573.1 SirA family protein [Sulfurihydrogenibium sp. YO3AOP1]MBX0310333.1 sulfurtransferase TusA family protein [Sulfurihydrogenibium sp.]HBT98001.1 sulfurtransferase TusA family protein [Sulfurihydrogenibium sp.]